MTVSITKLIAADELLRMGNIGRCELIHGELIMMSPAGAEHGVMAARFSRFLGAFVDDRDLGVVFGAETGFKVDVDPDTVRAPDASFVRKSRIGARITKKFFQGPPDIAVEVVSPDDTRREVDDKANMWLARGTVTVWVADPDTMTITVLRVGEKPQVFGRGKTIKNEPLLPGFELSVDSVFKMP
jgi:Uma2 family endonuclease